MLVYANSHTRRQALSHHHSASASLSSLALCISCLYLATLQMATTFPMIALCRSANNYHFIDFTISPHSGKTHLFRVWCTADAPCHHHDSCHDSKYPNGNQSQLRFHFILDAQKNLSEPLTHLGRIKSFVCLTSLLMPVVSSFTGTPRTFKP